MCMYIFLQFRPVFSGHLSCLSCYYIIFDRGIKFTKTCMCHRMQYEFKLLPRFEKNSDFFLSLTILILHTYIHHTHTHTCF